MRPKRRYRAVTGRFDPALNAKLKTAGFRWDGEARAWWRRLPIEDVPQLQAKYPFSIVEWPEVAGNHEEGHFPTVPRDP